MALPFGGMWLFLNPAGHRRPGHGCRRAPKVRNANNQLAESSAFQNADKSAWSILEAIDDVFAELHSAAVEPMAHLLDKLTVAAAVVRNDERLHLDPLGCQRAGQVPQPNCLFRGVCTVAPSYRSSTRHARALVQQRQHRVEDGAAGIFKVDIDAVGTGDPQSC